MSITELRKLKHDLRGISLALHEAVETLDFDEEADLGEKTMIEIYPEKIEELRAVFKKFLEAGKKINGGNSDETN